ncbi:MAG: N-acetylglucosamine kinase [Culicoidibacterales bacterium]
MSIIIGIDAGGTKTKIVAYDQTGNVIKRLTTQGANLANDKQTAIDIISAGIAEVADDKIAIKKVAIGMAGVVNNPLAPTLITAIENRWNCLVLLDNDVIFAHKAIFENGSGLLLSAGTGSIAIIRENQMEQYQIIGGYGHLFGDEASGYDIARRAIVYCTLQHDLGEKDVFYEAILTEVKQDNIRLAIPWLYKATKGEVAGLATVVAELAQKNNKVAHKILEESVSTYLNHIIKVIKQRKLNVSSFGLWGSVFQKNRIIADYINKEIKQQLQLTAVETTTIEITTAALF